MVGSLRFNVGGPNYQSSQGRPIKPGNFQLSLWDYSDLCKPTQDYVLGYVQPSLRDRAAEAFPFIERLLASVATADVGQISKVAGELF
jgi:hypothetical protein